MAESWQERTSLLLGDDKLKRLSHAKVLVIGLGGVGAYAAEMLCRAGVGDMTIVDGDVVNESNINRQLIALNSSIKLSKAELLAGRLLDINPKLKLTTIDEYLIDERIIEVLKMQTYDYVLDAIDTLSPKVYLMLNALKLNMPIVSSMGAGGKIDPALIKTADLSKTYNCGLAKAVRKRLKRLGVRKGIKTVFSSELVNNDAVIAVENEANKKSVVGTISYMPAIFGCRMAAVVIIDLTEKLTEA